MKCRIVLPLVFVVAIVASFAARAADGKLEQGDYVAVIGDSITEQRLYSKFIEDYLLMCKPALDLRATQFGWGGETARLFGPDGERLAAIPPDRRHHLLRHERRRLFADGRG